MYFRKWTLSSFESADQQVWHLFHLVLLSVLLGLCPGYGNVWDLQSTHPDMILNVENDVIPPLIVYTCFCFELSHPQAADKEWHLAVMTYDGRHNASAKIFPTLTLYIDCVPVLGNYRADSGEYNSQIRSS